MAVGRPAVDQLQERLAAAEGQMDHEQGVGAGDLRPQFGGCRFVVGDQLAADELDVAQPPANPVQVLLELRHLGLGVEVRLGPRPAQPDVHHVDLHERQLGPARLLGGTQRIGGQPAG